MGSLEDLTPGKTGPSAFPFPDPGDTAWGMDYRNALVTGASSGLGESVVKRLAARGIRVYALARRADRLQALSREAGPGEVVPLPVDVSDTDALVAAVREADAASGGLDLVVANAGVGGQKRATRLTWEEWVEPVLRVNVVGALATLTAVLPAMVERDRGHLVAVGSLAAARGFPGSGAYSASKAAVGVFMETLRLDLRKTGIRATLVDPGYVKTPLTEGNTRSMPFLMEREAAVDHIMKAIDREASVHAFPWPLAAATRLVRLLPNAVYDRLAR